MAVDNEYRQMHFAGSGYLKVEVDETDHSMAVDTQLKGISDDVKLRIVVEVIKALEIKSFVELGTIIHLVLEGDPFVEVVTEVNAGPAVKKESVD